MRLRVGIGTGSEEEKREKLGMLATSQQTIVAPQGMVGPEQSYALFVDVAKSLGFEMPEKYAMPPNSPQYQQAMQQRQGESRGFACACLRAAQQVAAGQDHWNGLRLNGRGGGVAVFSHSAQQGLGQPEGFK
jgi:hypothetical protein